MQTTPPPHSTRGNSITMATSATTPVSRITSSIRIISLLTSILSPPSAASFRNFLRASNQSCTRRFLWKITSGPTISWSRSRFTVGLMHHAAVTCQCTHLASRILMSGIKVVVTGWYLLPPSRKCPTSPLGSNIWNHTEKGSALPLQATAAAVTILPTRGYDQLQEVWYHSQEVRCHPPLLPLSTHPVPVPRVSSLVLLFQGTHPDITLASLNLSTRPIRRPQGILCSPHSGDTNHRAPKMTPMPYQISHPSARGTQYDLLLLLQAVTKTRPILLKWAWIQQPEESTARKSFTTRTEYRRKKAPEIRSR